MFANQMLAKPGASHDNRSWSVVDGAYYKGSDACMGSTHH